MIDFPFLFYIFVVTKKFTRMKKFLLFVGSALLAMSISAQTVTFTHNEWGEGNSNSQGNIAVEPSMAIEQGFKVEIDIQGTTTSTDVSLNYVVIDTTGGGWVELSPWGSVSVESGVVVGKITFNSKAAATNALLSLSTVSGDNSYDEAIIDFSKLTCTVSDPNYRDPNVETDDSYLPLSAIASSWGDCAVSTGEETTSIHFPNGWNCGAGWAWWGLAPAYLDVTEYESITVEFETTPCAAQLVVQTDNGTEGGENNAKAISAGATSATINFEDDAVFIGDEWAGVRAIYLQTSEEADLVITGAYFTYKTVTAVDAVAQNIFISNGFVASKGTISIYTTDGKKVAESAKEFNMNLLPKGVYIIQTPEGSAKYLK